MAESKKLLDCSYPRENRLRGRSNFLNLLRGRASKRLKGRFCEIIIGASSDSFTKFGIRVSKTAGDSPRRNRIKRIIREYLRNNKDHWPKDKSIIISVRSVIENESGLIGEIDDIIKEFK